MGCVAEDKKHDHRSQKYTFPRESVKIGYNTVPPQADTGASVLGFTAPIEIAREGNHAVFQHYFYHVWECFLIFL
jgi:hypothetical protein